ncbi:DUF6519 domain-containing protein [Nannocystaceae bacterium ST9]
MKTEISRDSHQPDRDYSGIHQQQGRMITDADWNELVSIMQEQIARAIGDLVGSGIPREQGAGLVSGPRIVPGAVYAEGHRARVLGQGPGEFAYATQRYLPSPPELPPGQALRFYVDVWDRTVTALEDFALRDPALRGADTCTRTQRVAQVKWCPLDVDPTRLPRRGNARLGVRRSVDENEQLGLGDYAFRLEVHEVRRAPEGILLTLKWSSENGAIAHRVAPVPPPEFLSERYVYEFFANVDEHHLGHVLAAWDDAAFPVRGVLATHADGQTWNPPAGKPFVRRWDGCCTIRGEGAQWELVEDALALDGGVSLVADGQAVQLIELGSALRLTLDDLWIELELENREFLVGDHWLVAVREAAPGTALVTKALPSGVEHRYLVLGTIDHAGQLMTASDADRRQRSFPPLSDLTASTIALDNHCQRLFADAETVQDALDALCDIEASDVRATLATCSGEPTVQSLLQAHPQAPLYVPDGRLTVQRVLGSLLCALDAARLPYDGGPHSGRWSLDGVQPRQVQEAIDGLAERKVSRSGDSIEGPLAVQGTLDVEEQVVFKGDLRIEGNLHVQGQTVEHETELVKGNVQLGDADDDLVTISGRVRSGHSSGALQIDANTTVSGELHATGGGRFDQDVEVAGKVAVQAIRFADATEVDTATDFGIPPGVICMWSGSVDAVPVGWTLCNGTNGAPDLRDRFVVGAGLGYAAGNVGGAAQVTLTTEQMPSHSHSYADIFWSENNGWVDVPGAWGNAIAQDQDNRGFEMGRSTSGVGGNQPHENRPPYYALAFIMKVGTNSQSQP